MSAPDRLTEPCPTCRGLGRVPAPGHTEAEMAADRDERMAAAGARMEARIERLKAEGRIPAEAPRG